MVETKTKATDTSVDAFIATIEHPARCADAAVLHALIERVPAEPPRMWVPSIVGFGQYHYKYDSGHEDDYLITGFPPRKQNLIVCIMPGFSAYGALVARQGKYKTGTSCLYINKLSDIDHDVLEDLVRNSIAWMRKKYP